MRILSNDDVAAVCGMEQCIDALFDGLRAYAAGDAVRRPRIDLFAPTTRAGEYACFSTMDGLVAGGYYALRVKPDIVSWPGGRRVTYAARPGLYGGLVLLFDADNAELLAVMNDGYVQHMRVGALAALGARYLARQDATTVGVLGSGGMARSFAHGFAAVRDIAHVKVYSPTRQHAREYAREIGDELGVRVSVKESPERALRGVDIVATCTNSVRPVLRGEWLEPGTYVANVSARELHETALERITLVGRLLERGAFDPWGFRDDRYEIRTAVMSYVAGGARERAGIPTTMHDALPGARVVPCVDWASGQAIGRTSAADVTALAELSGGLTHQVAASEGIQGLQFAAVAGRAYELAARDGRGTELPTELFLQDIPT